MYLPRVSHIVPIRAMFIIVLTAEACQFDQHMPHSKMYDTDQLLSSRNPRSSLNVYALKNTYHSSPSSYNPEQQFTFTSTTVSVELAQSSNFQNIDHYTFGSGRLNCMGIHLKRRGGRCDFMKRCTRMDCCCFWWNLGPNWW
jgi:hypothetical protein